MIKSPCLSPTRRVLNLTMSQKLVIEIAAVVAENTFQQELSTAFSARDALLDEITTTSSSFAALEDSTTNISSPAVSHVFAH